MAIDWETIRAEYEAGANQSDLARRHSVSRAAIQKHIASEGWTQNISQALSNLTEAKVAGVVAGCNPKKKAAALDRAADARAAVIERHRQEWTQYQLMVADVLLTQDFNMAKLAKITAETLKIRQEGERKAWGITEIRAPAEITLKPDISLYAKLQEVYASEAPDEV